MRILKTAALAFGAVLLSTPLLAQGWSAQTRLMSDWFFGDAMQEGAPISFGCAGSYPGADWTMGEGIGPLDPYLVLISMTDAIGVETFSDGPRTDVVFVIGETGYLLPEVWWNALLSEWGSYVSVGDPLITALLAGGDAQLWSGPELVAEISGAGLAASVAEMINFCDAHWIASGAPLPSHAAETIATLRAQPAPPATMEQVMLDEITGHCGGPGQVRADAVGRSDFDGDGVEDILLHWSGVSCQTDNPLLAGPGAGECGSAVCLTTAYVSSSIRAGNAPFEILAPSAGVDPEMATDILLGVGVADCNRLNMQPDCQTRHRWNGVTFARIE